MKSDHHAVLNRCVVVHLAHFKSPTFGTPLHGDNSEPGQPCVETISGKEVQEGEEVELQCESEGGRPPAEIMWWDGEGRRIVSDVTEHVKRMEDRKTFKTVSTLRFKPSTGQQVKCSAHNDAFPAMRLSHGLWLALAGQPAVQEIQLADGEDVTIRCSTEQIK